MRTRRRRTIALWLLSVAAAVWVVAHADYTTDLSAFLPARPTPLQRLLVDQLRDGPASRLILIAIEGGDAAARTELSARMARRLRDAADFSSVENGEASSEDRDEKFLFENRYLLSHAVEPGRFAAPGLDAALDEAVANLNSSAGLLMKSLLLRDPTGEMLQIMEQMTPFQASRLQNGVWISADGARALLVAQSAAQGSDIDAQERALAMIRSAFESSLTAAAPATSMRLRYSGPGVFAVDARAKIKRAAARLSAVSSLLVVAVLLAAYRSFAALGLGLLPVGTGAVTGIAAVALGFGAVHGITLGFGVTLIGEAVDYSVYFFIQSARDRSQHPSVASPWQRSLWPTVRLGMLTSICGFASLLPSGFPGLAQLGLYSICGLLAAALVTRFVLPELLPRRFVVRDLTRLGLTLSRLRDALRGRGGSAIALAAAGIALSASMTLYTHRTTLWNRELSALSPISTQDQRYDAELRADLGAADVLDFVVVAGPTLEAALRGAERAGRTLDALKSSGIVGGYESPAAYLPSLATQQARRSALPTSQALQDVRRAAAAAFRMEPARLEPFIQDVEAARRAPFVTPQDLRGTSLAIGFTSLIIHRPDRWSALLPLHAVAGREQPHIDVARVAAALEAAGCVNTQVLDIKAQADALYAGYLHEAIWLSCGGFASIAILLVIALRSPQRVARVLGPLVLAVLAVTAGLVGTGRQLTILHLVGMLLIVAVGSNYALFFDRQAAEPSRDEAADALTLASLAIANGSTVIAFGLLSFSRIPVLEALGTTVAPGAFLALVFSALLPTLGRSHA